MEEVKHQTWRHTCGWYRTRSLDAIQAREIIRHPLHGDVTSMEAALLDIEQHDCNAYREAMQRLHGVKDAGQTPPVPSDDRKSQAKARNDDKRWFGADDGSGREPQERVNDTRGKPPGKARPDGRSRKAKPQGHDR